MSLYVIEDTCDPKVVGRLAKACDITIVWMAADINVAARYSTQFGPCVSTLIYSTELATPGVPKVSDINQGMWPSRGIAPGVVSWSPHDSAEYVRHEILSSFLKEQVPTIVIVSATMLPVVHETLSNNQGPPITIHPGRVLGVACEYQRTMQNMLRVELHKQIQ